MVYSPQTEWSFVFIWVIHAVFIGLKTEISDFFTTLALS